METYEKKYKEALEKAKAYDKAIEKLRDFYKDYDTVSHLIDVKEELANLFPELTESEDEKVRKELITHCRNTRCVTEEGAERIAKWIDWLEKQGSEPKWCHHKVDLSGCSEEYRKAYYDGWNNCNQQHSQCKSESNDVIKCLINGMKFYYEDNEEATWGTEKFSMKVKDILSWLEKQGDNTPTIIWHNIDEKPEEMKELFCEWESDDATWHDVAFYDEESHTFRHAKMPINVTKWVYVDELLEKQGEQKPFDYENANISQHDFAPKVEPKFHEGEWIVDNIGVAHQIERPVLIVANNTFGYDIVGGGYLDDDSDVHLWTIQDAKDGDVLAVDSKPFIYNGSKNEVTVGAYCGFNSEHKFSFAYNYVINQNITPATKEQRDQLKKAMTDAGYEWNAENKELKEINKNTDVGHEHFSELLENDNSDNIDDYASQCAYCMSHDWLKDTATWDDVEKACKLGAKWNEKHHKPAWSEEDEIHINGIIAYLCYYKLSVNEENMNVANGVQKEIDWLKSLKQRIGG